MGQCPLSVNASSQVKHFSPAAVTRGIFSSANISRGRRTPSTSPSVTAKKLSRQEALPAHGWCTSQAAMAAHARALTANRTSLPSAVQDSHSANNNSDGIPLSTRHANTLRKLAEIRSKLAEQLKCLNHQMENRRQACAAANAAARSAEVAPKVSNIAAYANAHTTAYPSPRELFKRVAASAPPSSMIPAEPHNAVHLPGARLVRLIHVPKLSMPPPATASVPALSSSELQRRRPRPRRARHRIESMFKSPLRSSPANGPHSCSGTHRLKARTRLIRLDCFGAR